MKKSKKILSVALSMLMAVTPASGLLTLTGCDEPPPPGPDQGAEFTVSFNTNGGSTITDLTVAKNGTATKPTDPTKAGYVFDGWYADASLTTEFNFSSQITADTTLYAKWTKLHTVTVIWGEGKTNGTLSVKDGEKITGLQAPTVSGKEFVGLYTDSALTTSFNTNTVITNDTTLYAKWNSTSEAAETYTVTIVWGQGIESDTIEVEEGNTIDFPTPPPVAGKTFAGWYTDSSLTTSFNTNSFIEENTTIYAKWTDVVVEPENYTVTIVWGAGIANSSMDVEGGETIVLPQAPTVAGKIFSGWFTNSTFTTAFNSNSPIVNNITIYAKWTDVSSSTEVYTVSFVTGISGYSISPQQVVSGDKARCPIEKPSTANDIFSGWYIDDSYNDLYDFDTPVTGNITLYANRLENAQNVTTVRFGGYVVDATQQETYNKMVNEFNETYGKYKGIYVQPSIVSNYAQYLERCNVSLVGEDGFDIYMLSDRNFKGWAQSRGEQIRNLGASVDANGNQLTSAAMFDEQLDNMWKGMIDRFRLNVDGWTSYEDDQLWMVPIDSNPTALYYNRTVLEKNGVIVISVEDKTITAENYDELAEKYDFADPQGENYVSFDDAEGRTLLELWNDNLIADLFLNKYDDLKFVTGSSLQDAYGNDIESSYLDDEGIKVPSKGFYRNMYPRNSADPSVAKFTLPAEGEALIFNASIAMSWDEIEDLAMICTKDVNSNSTSTYGYYTQWWFCYGWSVGGDCMEDMTGDGAWAFSLSDYSANYMVTENACTQVNPSNPSDPNRYYIGEYTGKLYSAGDTLDFLDKLDVTKLVVEADGTGQTAVSGDVILPNDDGSFEKVDIKTGNATPIGQSVAQLGDKLTDTTAIRASIRTSSSQDQSTAGIKFIELPSTKEAFTRFCRLVPSDVDSNSVGVSYPVSSATRDETTDITNLGNGTVAFVIERGDKLGHLRNIAREYNQSWGVANVPVFKEYANPDDPDDDTVKRQGVQAGHSEAIALGISAGCKTENVDEAWAFIQWMAADYFYLDPDDGSVYFGDQRKTTDVRYRAGQAVKADNGYIPNQPELFEQPNDEGTDAGKTTFIKEGEENLNLHLFAYAIEYEQPGDWWYLPTNVWIQQWEGTLNAQDGVRGGKLTSIDWFNSGIIRKTNVKLAEVFNFYYNAENIKQLWRQKLGANIQ